MNKQGWKLRAQENGLDALYLEYYVTELEAEADALRAECTNLADSLEHAAQIIKRLDLHRCRV